MTFSGDVAVRVRKGDSSVFLFSAGGYHPEFAVPPGFPSLQRVKISLADTKRAEAAADRLHRDHLQHAPDRREDGALS